MRASSLPSPVGLLAVASGVAVADNYYLQPLLASIGADLGVGAGALGVVASLALAGYALGLLLVVPLGDVVDRRPLVVGLLSLTTVGLLAMALAPSVPVLGVGAFLVGSTSVVAQVFVPYAASVATAASRGRVVGVVMSGILLGILGARVVGGLVGGAAGWRAVYAGAAGATFALLLVLVRRLPAEPERHRSNGRADVPYREVLAGVAALARSTRRLRVRAVYGACGFAVFSAVWTTLAFHLRDAYDLGTTAVAAVALLGLGGVLLAPRVGRLSDRGRATAVTGTSYAVLLAATGLLALGGGSLALLLVGLVVMDLAIAAGHVTNLGVVYGLVAETERSRATTVYMTIVFLGGATGSLLASQAYERAGWSGVSTVTAVAAATALVTWLVHLPVRAPVRFEEPWPEAVA